MVSAGHSAGVRSARDLRHELIAELYREGLPVAGIAQRAGVCIKTVRNVARRAGLPPRNPSQPERDGEILARYVAGEPVGSIAADCGVRPFARPCGRRPSWDPAAKGMAAAISARRVRVRRAHGNRLVVDRVARGGWIDLRTRASRFPVPDTGRRRRAPRLLRIRRLPGAPAHPSESLRGRSGAPVPPQACGGSADLLEEDRRGPGTPWGRPGKDRYARPRSGGRASAGGMAGTPRRRRVGRDLPRRERAARQVLGDQATDGAMRGVLAKDIALQQSPAGSNARTARGFGSSRYVE